MRPLKAEEVTCTEGGGTQARGARGGGSAGWAECRNKHATVPKAFSACLFVLPIVGSRYNELFNSTKWVLYNEGGVTLVIAWIQSSAEFFQKHPPANWNEMVTIFFNSDEFDRFAKWKCANSGMAITEITTKENVSKSVYLARNILPGLL